MKSFSTVSFALLSFMVVAPSALAEKTRVVVFNPPPELLNADGTVLDAHLMDMFSLDHGELKFLEDRTSETEADGDGTSQLQLRGISDERHLQQACPPKSWSCRKCTDHPSWGKRNPHICKVCGNCRRRRSLLEQHSSSSESILETSHDEPMGGYACKEVAQDKVQQGMAALVAGREVANGLGPAQANVKVYVCEN
jgi:hypothetical protein